MSLVASITLAHSTAIKTTRLLNPNNPRGPFDLLVDRFIRHNEKTKFLKQLEKIRTLNNKNRGSLYIGNFIKYSETLANYAGNNGKKFFSITASSNEKSGLTFDLKIDCTATSGGFSQKVDAIRYTTSLDKDKGQIEIAYKNYQNHLKNSKDENDKPKKIENIPRKTRVEETIKQFFVNIKKEMPKDEETIALFKLDDINKMLDEQQETYIKLLKTGNDHMEDNSNKPFNFFLKPDYEMKEYNPAMVNKDENNNEVDGTIINDHVFTKLFV